jgi:hypothetical protein
MIFGSSYGRYRCQMWRQIFLWRVCHDILPIRENVHKKKIIRKPFCPVYGRGGNGAPHFMVVQIGKGCMGDGNIKLQKCIF